MTSLLQQLAAPRFEHTTDIETTALARSPWTPEGLSKKRGRLNQLVDLPSTVYGTTHP